VVIVFPALLLVVSLFFQGFEYYRARQTAETAARQAVDAARVYGASDTDGTARADDVLAQLGAPLDDRQVSVVHQGNMVIATVTGRPPQLVPGLDLAVRARASGPAERFTGS
jgi:Flp pilus assembly protein TadG